MKVHKDPSSSTVLKRKAENNGDDSESELDGKAKPSHQTKKAKPTSGYVAGTTEKYKGTMREIPKPRSFITAGALENKSINISLKHHRKFGKQDTKNLNRNAEKPKMPHGVSDSSLCQVPWSNTVNVAGHESNIPRPPQSGGARSREGGQTWNSSGIKEKGRRWAEREHEEAQIRAHPDPTGPKARRLYAKHPAAGFYRR